MDPQESTQLLTLQYRPISLKQLLGQDSVVSMLSGMLDKQSIAPVYLLNGPRGTGKTSTARILSRCLLCQQGPTASPCDQCVNCLACLKGEHIDVVEMDGASKTSIADAKDLQQDILFSPSLGRYRIYIIDEVHMLSQSAFNALLKTIEEPPAYIIFILATTEFYKVPETIRSRCQIYRFSLIDPQIMMGALSQLIQEKNLQAEQSAIQWIAQRANGSLREAYMLLQQLFQMTENLTLSFIQSHFGLLTYDRLDQLFAATFNKDNASMISILSEFVKTGGHWQELVQQCLYYCHDLFLKSIPIQESSAYYYPLENLDEQQVSRLSPALWARACQIIMDCQKNLQGPTPLSIQLELMLYQIQQLVDAVDIQQITQKLQSIQTQWLSEKEHWKNSSHPHPSPETGPNSNNELSGIQQPREIAGVNTVSANLTTQQQERLEPKQEHWVPEQANSTVAKDLAFSQDWPMASKNQAHQEPNPVSKQSEHQSEGTCKPAEPNLEERLSQNHGASALGNNEELQQQWDIWKPILVSQAQTIHTYLAQALEKTKLGEKDNGQALIYTHNTLAFYILHTQNHRQWLTQQCQQLQNWSHFFPPEGMIDIQQRAQYDPFTLLKQYCSVVQLSKQQENKSG